MSALILTQNAAACSLTGGFDFELPSGAVEAYVELLEEINLTQKKWHVLGARPREGERHRFEITNPGMNEKRSGVLCGQISCECYEASPRAELIARYGNRIGILQMACF